MAPQVTGALIAFAGGLLGICATQIALELRARREERRAEGDRRGRVRGMARMVGAELRIAHLRATAAPIAKAPERDYIEFATQAWDRYGPDLCSELPLEIINPVLVAYSSIDLFVRGITGKGDESGVDEEIVSTLMSVPEGRDLLDKNQRLREKDRASLVRDLRDGYNALIPYFRVESAVLATAGGDQATTTGSA